MSRRRRGERGASAVELVLYMPILLFVIFLVIQFALVYLGNSAAGSIAREAARTARVSCNWGQGQEAGYRYARGISSGILDGVVVDVAPVAGGRMRATVTGKAQKLVPFWVPRVSQTVEGPVEHFVGVDGDGGCAS